MNLHTYDSGIKIWQAGEVPKIGDKVEDVINREIVINSEKTGKMTFMVEDGVITKQLSNVKWGQAIILAVFIIMAIWSAYLIWLWVG